MKGPVLVRQIIGPMKLPLTQSANGLLLHARPPEDYTRFDDEAAARRAIDLDATSMARMVEPVFEILSVELHEAIESDKVTRQRKVAKARRKPSQDEFL